MAIARHSTTAPTEVTIELASWSFTASQPADQFSQCQVEGASKNQRLRANCSFDLKLMTNIRYSGRKANARVPSTIRCLANSCDGLTRSDIYWSTLFTRRPVICRP